MKKSYLYIAMLILFAMAAGFIVVKQKNKTVSFYPLQNRKNISTQTEEWKKVKKNFEKVFDVELIN